MAMAKAKGILSIMSLISVVYLGHEIPEKRFFRGAEIRIHSETGRGEGTLPEVIRVPRGKNVLPNGKFAPGEWADAKEVKTAAGVALFFKHDETYLYLGIKFLAEMHTGVDLYLGENEGRRKKLHVSAALGEAEWNDGLWTDIEWGTNALWTANSIGLIVVNGERKTVPLEGFEFQISRSLLAGSGWRLFFHLKRPELKFPVESDQNSTAHWLWLEISGE
ncbi:MAG: hypothetical protein OEW18_06055 [Candidatus Aminicenantes bacterium]|nr:hypothetical protein [Candidatus Aminicenantes bacterium]